MHKPESPAAYNAFSIKQIQCLKIKRNKSGLHGALIGAASGAIAGVIIGLASGDDKIESYSNSTDLSSLVVNAFVAVNNAFAMRASEKALNYGAAEIIYGGIIGALIGNLAHKKFVINGNKQSFEVMRMNVLDMAYGKKN